MSVTWCDESQDLCTPLVGWAFLHYCIYLYQGNEASMLVQHHPTLLMQHACMLASFEHYVGCCWIMLEDVGLSLNLPNTVLDDVGFV